MSINSHASQTNKKQPASESEPNTPTQQTTKNTTVTAEEGSTKYGRQNSDPIGEVLCFLRAKLKTHYSDFKWQKKEHWPVFKWEGNFVSGVECLMRTTLQKFSNTYMIQNPTSTEPAKSDSPASDASPGPIHTPESPETERSTQSSPSPTTAAAATPTNHATVQEAIDEFRNAISATGPVVDDKYTINGKTYHVKWNEVPIENGILYKEFYKKDSSWWEDEDGRLYKL